ncbi:hypothetical protein LXL04_005513 [Taraxacum kok-saghyz]
MTSIYLLPAKLSIDDGPHRSMCSSSRVRKRHIDEDFHTSVLVDHEHDLQEQFRYENLLCHNQLLSGVVLESKHMFGFPHSFVDFSSISEPSSSKETLRPSCVVNNHYRCTIDYRIVHLSSTLSTFQVTLAPREEKLSLFNNGSYNEDEIEFALKIVRTFSTTFSEEETGMHLVSRQVEVCEDPEE